MKKKILGFVIVVVLLGISIEIVVAGDSVENPYEILLKSRHFVPSEGISCLERASCWPCPTSGPCFYHVIIQFYHTPNSEERKTLNEMGVELLGYIPNKARFTKIDMNNKLHDVIELPFVRAITNILPEDKIAPRIRERSIGEWAINPNGTVNLTIMFFKDIPLEEARQRTSTFCDSLGCVEVIDEATMINALVVMSPNSDFVSLLVEPDIVQWVNEIPPEPITFNDGTRAAIGVNTVQSTLYNLDGTNVVAGEWDGGWVDTTHDDLERRVTIGDAGSSTGDHPTHVAGIMLGNGTLSESAGGTALQWRGMATNATVISYEWWDAGINELSEEYNESIKIYDIDLSTNSWGWSYHGDYHEYSVAIENVSTGAYGKKLPVMWAAGNERPACDNGEYDCIIVPGTAKNTITVGATNSDDDSMTTFSSWGPTDDGRIKPDIVAPGCENLSYYIAYGYDEATKNPNTSIWSTIPEDTYYGMCGTSMATPAVSGSVALMLEDYWNTHNGVSPLPSTFKAILIQTAKDLNNTGPDYTTGYGRINVTKAVNLIRSDNSTNGDTILEGKISDQGQTDYFDITVPSGQSELKVTVAWDDYPGTVNADPALVNNLDVVLISPTSIVYYPWILDEDNPGDPATTGVDSINNVEQINVSNPATGNWKLRINGTTIPNPTQRYSIVSNLPLDWPDDKRFYIEDSTGKKVAFFGDKGNVVLKGGLIDNTVPVPNSDKEFIIQDSSGNPITMINSTGDLIIKGDVTENQATLTNPLSKDFIMQNSTGGIVAYINESGYMFLRGQLFDNSNP